MSAYVGSGHHLSLADSTRMMTSARDGNRRYLLTKAIMQSFKGQTYGKQNHLVSCSNAFWSAQLHGSHESAGRSQTACGLLSHQLRERLAIRYLQWQLYNRWYSMKRSPAKSPTASPHGAPGPLQLSHISLSGEEYRPPTTNKKSWVCPTMNNTVVLICKYC